ncbi:uncharacterized protein LOC143302194 [Babylonia areolata]|uniref:uncharacterized protein LOC143302194 n=1 Tax=Babylonia areolata TaxID=304850 RepID=UPI003FD2F275
MATTASTAMTFSDTSMHGSGRLAHTVSPVPGTDSNSADEDTNSTQLLDVQDFLHQQNLDFISSVTPTLVFLVVVLVVGTAGNSVVLAVYCRRFRPSVTRTYIVAISICGLLTTTLSVPAELLEIRYYFTFTDAWSCKLSRSVKSFFSFLAACILVAVALERHGKICGPYFRRLLSLRVRWSLLGCVLYSALITLPYTVIAGPRTVTFPGVNVSGFRCSTGDDYDSSYFYVTYIVITGLTFLVCLIIITVSYVRIAWRLWQHQRHRGRGKSIQPTPHRTRRTNEVPVIQLRVHTEDGGSDNRNGLTQLNSDEALPERSAVMVREEHLPAHRPSPEPHGQNETIGPTTHTLSVPGGVQQQVPDNLSSSHTSLQPIQLSTAASTDTVNETKNETHVSESEDESVMPAGIPDETSADPQKKIRRSSPAALRLQAVTRWAAARRGRCPQEPNNTTASMEHPKENRVRRKKTKKTTATMPRSPSSVRKIPTRTTFVMFLLTAVCVLVNYLPYQVVASLHAREEWLEREIGKNTYHVCFRSYFLHSVLSPLLLCFCSAGFQRECRRLCLQR